MYSSTCVAAPEGPINSLRYYGVVYLLSTGIVAISAVPEYVLYSVDQARRWEKLTVIKKSATGDGTLDAKPLLLDSPLKQHLF